MIKLVNVSKYYHNEGVVSLGLQKVNLEFRTGEFVVITGESGSGKSTLLNIISGIDTYEDGELYINGEETSHFVDDDWEEYRKQKVAFIFQNYNLIDSYNVLKNVEIALINQGYDLKSRRAKAKEILNKVGLGNHLKHRASKLSGGEKQRLAIARALAKDSDIIIADEPTGNLDIKSGEQVLALLNEVAKDKTVLVVTHNYEQAAPYVSREIRLFDGEVVEDKQIKPVTFKKQEKKTYPKMSEFKKSATLSLYNFFGQPKKTILMLFVSLATVLFVFLLYGSILEVDDYPSINTDYRFRSTNIYKERVVVVRKDKQNLDENDYNFFKSNKKIKSIIKEDSVLDIQFTLSNENLQGYDYFRGFITVQDNFDEEKLIGRLPEKEGEILISSYIYEKDYERIISYLNKEYQFALNTGNNYLFEKEYKLVGFYNSTDYLTKFVITKEEIKDLFHYTLSNNQLEFNFESKYENKEVQFERVLVDKSLKKNQIKARYLNSYLDNKTEFAFKWEENALEALAADDKYINGCIYVSPELYKEMDLLEYGQYTLHLKDVKDAKAVLNYLYENGYYGLSFYLSFYRNTLDIDHFFTKLFRVIVLAFSILVIYFISYLVFKAILNSKVHDYTILRIIGYQKSNIRQIILLEILTSFLFSYLLFFIIYQFIRIKYPVMYNYEFRDYLIIGLINLFLGALITMKFIRYQKKRSLFSNLRVEG